MSDNRAIHTTFCDDVRQEIRNKTSMIGVYNGSLVIQHLPVVLPKLCLVVDVSTPVDYPFEKLIVRVIRGEGDVLGELEIPSDVLALEQDKVKEAFGDDEEDTVAVFSSVMTFSPFSIESETILKVRAITETGELKGQSLRILKQDPDSPDLPSAGDVTPTPSP